MEDVNHGRSGPTLPSSAVERIHVRGQRMTDMHTRRLDQRKADFSAEMERMFAKYEAEADASYQKWIESSAEQERERAKRAAERERKREAKFRAFRDDLDARSSSSRDAATKDVSADGDATAEGTTRVDAAVANAPSPPDSNEKKGGDDKSPSDGEDWGNGTGLCGDDKNLPPSPEATGGKDDEESDPPGGLVGEDGPPRTPSYGTGGDYEISPPEGNAGELERGASEETPYDEALPPPHGKVGGRGNERGKPPVAATPPSGRVGGKVKEGEPPSAPKANKGKSHLRPPSDASRGGGEPVFPSDGKVGEIESKASTKVPVGKDLTPPYCKMGGEDVGRRKPPDPGPPVRYSSHVGTRGTPGSLPPGKTCEGQTRRRLALERVENKENVRLSHSCVWKPSPDWTSESDDGPCGNAATTIGGKENVAPRRGVEWVLAPDWASESDDYPCGKAPAGYKSQHRIIRGATVPRVLHVRVEQKGGDKDPPWSGPREDHNPDPTWDRAEDDVEYETGGYDNGGHDGGYSGEEYDADIVGESYDGVYLGGYSDGHAEGYEDGYGNGYDDENYDYEVSDDGQDSWSDYS